MWYNIIKTLKEKVKELEKRKDIDEEEKQDIEWLKKQIKEMEKLIKGGVNRYGN